MSISLEDKVVVITGASSGLGLEVAKQLAMQGCKLALIAPDKQKLDTAAKSIEGKHQLFACDVTSNDQIKQTVQQIIEANGSIDILVSNAGVWTDNEIEIKDQNRRKYAFEVNALGAIQFIEEVLSYMKSSSKGHICAVISSAGAQDTEAGDNVFWKTYGATKWAMSGYTKALTKELVDTNIRVTSFMPGGFESDLYDNAGLKDTHNQPWMMRVEDVAETLVFALTRPVDVQIEKVLVTKKQVSPIE